MSVKLSYQLSEEHMRMFTLCIDGETWKEVHIQIYGRKPRLVSSHLSLEDLYAYVDKLELKRAKSYALRCLAKRSYHSGELKNKLEKLCLSSEVITSVISWCKELGVLDDDDWVMRFIQKLLSRNLGPIAIRQRLIGRGLNPDLVSQFDSEEKQKTRLDNLLKRRYTSHDLTCQKTRRRVIAALSRKGFQLNLIFEMLDSRSG